MLFLNLPKHHDTLLSWRQCKLYLLEFQGKPLPFISYGRQGLAEPDTRVLEITLQCLTRMGQSDRANTLLPPVPNAVFLMDIRSFPTTTVSSTVTVHLPKKSVFIHT